MSRPNNDQSHLRHLRDAYAQMGCIPSYSQIAKALGFTTKNAAFKLAQRLIASGHLVKVMGGRLVPGPAFFTLELSNDGAQVGLGDQGNVTHLMQAQALNQLVIAKPSKTVLVRVGDDAMLNAGIRSGDVAVVEMNLQASTGDIVVAEIDGIATIKEFRKDWRQPKHVSRDGDVRAVNQEETPGIIGVVRGIIRSFRPPAHGEIKLQTNGISR